MSAKREKTEVLSPDELRQLAFDPKVDFGVLVEAQHRTWREEAKQSKKSVPFFDHNFMQIDPDEYLKSILAL